MKKCPYRWQNRPKGLNWRIANISSSTLLELEQTEPESSRMIEVHEFVKTEQIDPIFLERVYYLEPDTLSKGYNALVGALQEMEVAGICTWTMRKRSYLGALQASGKTPAPAILCGMPTK